MTTCIRGIIFKPRHELQMFKKKKRKEKKNSPIKPTGGKKKNRIMIKLLRNAAALSPPTQSK